MTYYEGKKQSEINYVKVYIYSISETLVARV
jgi:hypothetical protein